MVIVLAGGGLEPNNVQNKLLLISSGLGTKYKRYFVLSLPEKIGLDQQNALLIGKTSLLSTTSCYFSGRQPRKETSVSLGPRLTYFTSLRWRVPGVTQSIDNPG